MNDLIYRQDAIGAIDVKNVNKGIISALQSIIEELPSAQQWTLVSKGLPKKGGWYLVTWEDQFKTVRRVAVSEFIEPKGLTDIGHFEGFVLNEVIAWMPLPEPYRGGESE